MESEKSVPPGKSGMAQSVHTCSAPAIIIEL